MVYIKKEVQEGNYRNHWNETKLLLLYCKHTLLFEGRMFISTHIRTINQVNQVKFYTSSTIILKRDSKVTCVQGVGFFYESLSPCGGKEKCQLHRTKRNDDDDDSE